MHAKTLVLVFAALVATASAQDDSEKRYVRLPGMPIVKTPPGAVALKRADHHDVLQDTAAYLKEPLKEPLSLTITAGNKRTLVQPYEKDFTTPLPSSVADRLRDGPAMAQSKRTLPQPLPGDLTKPAPSRYNTDVRDPYESPPLIATARDVDVERRTLPEPVDTYRPIGSPSTKPLPLSYLRDAPRQRSVPAEEVVSGKPSTRPLPQSWLRTPLQQRSMPLELDSETMASLPDEQRLKYSRRVYYDDKAERVLGPMQRPLPDTMHIMARDEADSMLDRRYVLTGPDGQTYRPLPVEPGKVVAMKRADEMMIGVKPEPRPNLHQGEQYQVGVHPLV